MPIEGVNKYECELNLFDNSIIQCFRISNVNNPSMHYNECISIHMSCKLTIIIHGWCHAPHSSSNSKFQICRINSCQLCLIQKIVTLSYFSKHMFHTFEKINPFIPFLLLTLAFKVSMV